MRVTIQREDPCFEVVFSGWAEQKMASPAGFKRPETRWKGLHAACHPANCVPYEMFYVSSGITARISRGISFSISFLYILRIPRRSRIELEMSWIVARGWNANYLYPLLDLWFKKKIWEEERSRLFFGTLGAGKWKKLRGILCPSIIRSKQSKGNTADFDPLNVLFWTFRRASKLFQVDIRIYF